MSDQKSNKFNDAFKGLAGLKKQLEEKQKAPPPPPPKTVVTPKRDDDATAFARAMSGVKPIGPDHRGERVRAKETPVISAARVEDDSDALIDLASAIDVDPRLEGLEPGRVAFSRGLDAKIVRRLERGEFAIDGELDLHGKRRSEAEAALERFLKQARANKWRCVLVVTGKGLHSDATGPVLGDAIRTALGRTFVAHVLAYSVAKAEHGGDGALYVLLRRR